MERTKSSAAPRFSSDGGDRKIVFLRQGFHLIHGDEVRPGEEKLDRVEAGLRRGGESFRERGVQDEGAGSRFRNLAEGDGGFHVCRFHGGWVSDVSPLLPVTRFSYRKKLAHRSGVT
jgi:hypothetical protein